ncbi:MAG: hypothetical protein KIT33_08640 [Candidatus Kapabacteria bacterium]|nr:hypothetical protein [Ignavibacteriota bacterium]MCW5885023.1 hypothetical protein [Candidatus Kapabacteria bacterium]
MKRFIWLLIVMMPFLSYGNFATEDVNDLIIEGNSQLSNGNYLDAIQFFNRALEIEAENYLAFYGKGLAYEKLYYLDTAILNYRKAIYNKDDFSLAFYRSGVLKYNFNLYSQALKDFEKVTQLNSNNLEAMLYTANCFKKMGLFIGASDLYKKLAEKSKSHKEFMLQSCKARIDNEAIENTICHFDSLVIIYPDYDSAFYYRGMCKMNAGLFLPAIDDFSIAINLNDKFTGAYIYRGRAKQMLDSKKSKEGNEDLIAWKQIQPDFIDIELEKAYDYYFDSLYYDAIEHFNNVVSADSGRTDAILSLGLCYYGVKNFVRALNFANMVLHKSPQNIDAELLKAKIFHGIEKEKDKQNKYINVKYIATITSSDVLSGNVINVLKQAFDRTMSYAGFIEPIYHYDSILVSTEKIIKLDPTNIDGYLIRAETSSNRRKDSVAEYCYAKAIELSNEPECYFKRGLYYLKKKEFNKSLDDFIKAYELGYQTLEIKIIKIILYEITERDAFRSAYLSSVFKDEILNASANYFYGYYLLEYLNDSRTAIKYFDKAIEIDPYYYDAYIYKNKAKNKKESGIHIR